MSNELRQQIYNNLNLKETEELVEIWQKNDRVEWSETTFEVLQEILQQRLGELPPQDEPIFEYTEDEEGDIQADEDQAIDDDNSPEFYKPKEVLWLDKWLYQAAIAAIVASVISSLLELPRMQRITLSYFAGNSLSAANFWSWVIAIVVFSFAVVLECILIYFPLKALGTILKILMEMEFNSRVIKT
jgi:hypothetical protein